MLFKRTFYSIEMTFDLYGHQRGLFRFVVVEQAGKASEDARRRADWRWHDSM
jgi:hypothetical protein